MNVSAREAARLLGVSERTVYRWAKRGLIPAHRLHERIEFNRTELLEWATAQRLPISPEVVRSAFGAEDQPSLKKALAAGGIHSGVGGTDVPSVLRAIVAATPLPDTVDREFLLDVLLARERLGSTAIGGGIAIPHARQPIVLGIREPLVSLNFLDHAIDFDAPDGQPVNVLFMIVSPTVPAHLHLLSRLSYALQDTTLRAALDRRAPAAELIDLFSRAEAAIGGQPAAASVGLGR